MGLGISVRNSNRFFCIECQPMRQIRSYSFSGDRNERRLISYWTIKGATGGDVSGKRQEDSKGRTGRTKDEGREYESRAKKKRRKKFYPVRRQRTFSISSNRVLVSPSSFLPPVRRTNFDSCFAYATFSSLPLPSHGLGSTKSTRPFYDRTFPVSTFRSRSLLPASSVRKAPFGITTNVHRSIDEGRNA